MSQNLFFRFGPRFPAINRAYDAGIRSYAKEIALKLGTLGTVHEGIYACLGGPNYETIAELRMLRQNGVDAVGKEEDSRLLLFLQIS